MKRFLAVASLFVALATAIMPAGANAQSFRRGGHDFNAVRSVAVPAGRFTIGVTAFLHHGEVNSAGTNLLVAARGGGVVPTKVLQVGPGDFCRVAYQLAPGLGIYDILYGGQALPAGAIGPWTAREGLLMETREYTAADLNKIESIQEAFEKARPFGGDYVAAVGHAFNPFCFQPEPFMSRYSGYLHIAQAGKYGFMTSSQDASFLLVNDKVVTSAPGRHAPLRRAAPGIRNDIQLPAGVHKFDYYHVAAGGDATMIAAWEVNPTSEKVEKPAAIPADVFRTDAVARIDSENLSTKSLKIAPDFMFAVEAEVPLPDNEQTLIKVNFRDTSARAVAARSRLTWDFGDGQTSDEPAPVHIYLRPGTYTVRLGAARAAAGFHIANRIVIDRPITLRSDKEYTLDDFLPIVARYRAAALDAASLLQLAAAFEAKVEQLEAGPEQKTTAELHRLALEGKPTDVPMPSREEMDRKRAEATPYVVRLVAAAKEVFLEPSVASGDEELMPFARRTISLARNRLGDSQLAYDLWTGAMKKAQTPLAKAECGVEAADVAINDLLKPELAKPLLEQASRATSGGRASDLTIYLQRVWGDYYAATGNGKAARKMYFEAESNFTSAKTFVERSAWRGAHNRSTEDFLKAEQFDRAAAEIRRWDRAFPAERIDGLLTYMYARYWFGRKQYDQAIALAEQLLVVNADSPYIDQVLLIAADSELKRDKPERALATLQSLLKDYPGSPLIGEAKQRIATIESGATAKKPARPPKK